MKDENKSNWYPINELEQYRRLLDNIPAELGILDVKGRFLFNTPSGIQDPEMRQWVIGKTNHEYCSKRGLPKSFADNRQKYIDQCIREKQAISFEEPITDKSGQIRHYIRFFSPVLDDNGNVTHVIGHGQEITELKKTEEALRKAIAEVKQLKNQLLAENIYLQEEIKLKHNFEEIISRSKALKNVLKEVEQVASTNATVLILGETGTGKELFVRAIHSISNRKDRPIVKVNCATLPANLIESELFGHEKGAFTGALSRKIGRFELADGGTIFLDEIGDLPMELQVKLLRVLQEGEFERLGNSNTFKIDVRIIAATNRNLQQAIETGKFREDLYYRLNVFPIKIPPLRERKDDIPLLIKYFSDKFGKTIGKNIESVDQKVMDALLDYDWPGNVRELENIIERAVIISKGRTLQLGDWVPSNSKTPSSKSLVTLEENERRYILEALERTSGRVSGVKGAAKILGVNASTLDSRMRKLGIK